MRRKKTLSPLAILLACFLWAGHSLYTCAVGDRKQEAVAQAAPQEQTAPATDTPTDRWAEPTDASTAAARSTESTTAVAGIEIPKYESSRGGQIIEHLAYTLSYDADFKTPQWVAWQLTAEHTTGPYGRKNSFSPDPLVRGAKAYHKDYTHSGYDRGHMAPAGDMKWSEQAMEESFYTSNICPQNQNLNRGDWQDLEEWERAAANRYGIVYIACGPIYTSTRPERIGANKVAVPDAFFKVILVNYPRDPRAYGFVFQNVAGGHPLTYYQRTVDEVEAATGMDFFSALPDKVENRIEKERPKM